MGSRERLKMVLDGADPVSVHNSRIDQMYRVRMVGGGEVAPLVVGGIVNRSTSDTLKIMKSPYEIAKEGGRHKNWYRLQIELGERQLLSGIRSLEKQIAAHEEWLQNPSGKVAGFDTNDERYKNGLLSKWREDILRHQEHIDILKGVLKEKGVGNEP